MLVVLLMPVVLMYCMKEILQECLEVKCMQVAGLGQATWLTLPESCLWLRLLMAAWDVCKSKLFKDYVGKQEVFCTSGYCIIQQYVLCVARISASCFWGNSWTLKYQMMKSHLWSGTEQGRGRRPVGLLITDKLINYRSCFFSKWHSCKQSGIFRIKLSDLSP